MRKSNFFFVLTALVIGGAGIWFVCGRDACNVNHDGARNETMGENVITDAESAEYASPEAVQEGGPSHEPPHPVSLPALFGKKFEGRELKLGAVLADNSVYARYFITYKSGTLTISGIMNVPKGEGPFPLLVLNHGYIDPVVYTNGRGLKREQDYLARHGYAALHTDYRNHAQSDKDPDAELALRLGYVEDAINAVYAARESALPFIDASRVGMLGHSMGGGVTLNVLAVQPDLVDAAVLFAPVSSEYRDNFDKWTRGDASRRQRAAQIIEAYGTPEDNPEFWGNVSVRNFFDHVSAPMMVHHGTADASVPLAWSQETYGALLAAGKEAQLFIYEGEPHEFIDAWPQVMQRTVDFFDIYVKGEKSAM